MRKVLLGLVYLSTGIDGIAVLVTFFKGVNILVAFAIMWGSLYLTIRGLALFSEAAWP